MTKAHLRGMIAGLLVGIFLSAFLNARKHERIEWAGRLFVYGDRFTIIHTDMEVGFTRSGRVYVRKPDNKETTQ